MGHYDSCHEVLDAAELEERKKEETKNRKAVIDFIYNDLQRRSLETILADILLQPSSYLDKAKRGWK